MQLKLIKKLGIFLQNALIKLKYLLLKQKKNAFYI